MAAQEARGMMTLLWVCLTVALALTSGFCGVWYGFHRHSLPSYRARWQESLRCQADMLVQIDAADQRAAAASERERLAVEKVVYMHTALTGEARARTEAERRMNDPEGPVMLRERIAQLEGEVRHERIARQQVERAALEAEVQRPRPWLDLK
jgi:hypothetical protein